MAFLSLVFNLGGPQTFIGALQLDALLNETTDLPSNITEYPVEDGPPVTDHITQSAERLTLSGVVTGAGVTMFGAGGRSKMIAAKEALRTIQEQRLPITIVTGMDVYQNFGMGNATISRTNEGEKLMIDCEFRKIRKVSLREADIPPEKVAGTKGNGAKGKAGQTGAKGGKVDESSAPQADQSRLHRGWFGDIAPSEPVASGGVSA